MERIGVVGLGRMGTAIANRLSAQQVPVVGWTRSGRAAEGVETVSNLADLIRASDTLILSLLDDAAVGNVLDALLEHGISGKLIIECSTVVPDVLRDRMAAIEEQGALAVDAPISGGPELVLSGHCGVFIGGTDAAASRAQRVLSGISDKVFHVGPLGAGLVMKTINNGMILAYWNGLNDFMPLAKRAGLPLETVLRILAGGPAGAPFLNARLPKILGEDDSIGFTISAMEKDRDVFIRVIQSHGLTSKMMEEFERVTRAAISEGDGDSDPATLVCRAYDRDTQA